MVKKSIKIYARLKKEKPENAISYQVAQNEECETITFHMNHLYKFINNKPQSYKFGKVFEKVIGEEATQGEVFDITAKPVVNSVLKGFNGTIFAYGQTGSGKTYAMTGSPQNYEERGLIPRSIEEIFRHIDRTSQKYTICISYLEIYNEIGYDLLNRKQHSSLLDDLHSTDAANCHISNNEFFAKNRARKVSLHDYGNGEFHLRNLSVQKVSTEQEAMRLLLEGDANRITVETPMNMFSSRSHCIFTIGIAAKNRASGKVRRSKLTLVDLAGSERVCKSNITGVMLHEAKHINLSLHYLEQVVVALSQRRMHVPFRNSMLTYLLKDSLSGNCLAVLLSTLAVNNKNVEETLATCKFAKRVADVTIEPEINEEIDVNHEVQHLRREIELLRKQLVQQTQMNINEKLTDEEKQKWKTFVSNYLQDNKDELPVTPFDMRYVRYCFQLLKESVKQHEEQKLKIKCSENAKKELVDQYRKEIKTKEEEINFLRSLLHSDVQQHNFHEVRSRSMQRDKENVPPPSAPIPHFEKEHIRTKSLSPAEKIAFEIYLKDPDNCTEIEFYKKSIENLHEIAINVTSVLEACQKNILLLKAKLENCGNLFEQGRLSEELLNEQVIYRNSLSKMHDLKNETKCFRRGLENAKQNVMQSFRQWYDNIDTSDIQLNYKTLHEYKSETRSRNLSRSRHRSHSHNSDRSVQEPNISDTSKITPSQESKFDIPQRYVSSSRHSSHSRHSDDRSLKSTYNHYNASFDTQAKSNYLTLKNYFYREHNEERDTREYMNHNKNLITQKPADRNFKLTANDNNFIQSRQNDISIYQTAINNNYPGNKNSPSASDRPHSAPRPRSKANNEHSLFYSSENHLSKNNLILQKINSSHNSSSSYSLNTDYAYYKSKTVPKVDIAKDDNIEAANNSYKSALHERQLLSNPSKILEKALTTQCNGKDGKFNNRNIKTLEVEEDQSSHEPAECHVFSAYPPTMQDASKISVQSYASISEDSTEFRDFMKNIPLTGDGEIDDEIVNFYRNKFYEAQNV